MKEKETYKKAREILERFSASGEVSITPPTSPGNNNSLFPNNGSTPIMNKRMNETMMANQNMNQTMNPNNLNATHLVHRNVKQLQMVNQTIAVGQLTRPSNAQNQSHFSQPSGHLDQTASPGPSSASQLDNTGVPSGPRTLPRPIIAPNRTLFDKLLDFMIGEGPNNR